MIIRRREKKNWNFDFSIYEKEDKRQTPRLFSLTKDNKPRASILQARYVPTGLEMDNLINLKNQISEKAIKVRANTQDIQDLWNLYAIVSEMWARVHDIFGAIIIEEVNVWESFIYKKLIRLNAKTYISYDNHIALINYSKQIYKLCQRVNIGIQVEKRFNARQAGLKGQIVE